MTVNEVKGYLGQYRLCMARAHRLRADMERFTASAPSINEERLCLIKKAEEIERLIASHEDYTQREILTRKYIFGDTLELIAEMLNFSPRHIQRILNTAAEKIGSNMVS